MSKHTQQQIHGHESPGLIERLQQAASSARSIAGQVWNGAKPMFDHGRTELAAALFTGHAHVMYMKGQEGLNALPDQAREHEPLQRQLQSQPQREFEGREM